MRITDKGLRAAVRAPEYESIEAFASYLADDEREEFTHEDLTTLGFVERASTAKVRAELETYGFKLAVREPGRRVRGCHSNDNDRWFGPGSGT